MASLWLLPRLLLFSVTLLALALVRADPTTHTDCSPAVANNTDFDWWFNRRRQNPCQILQNLLRQCDPDHTIHAMPESPLSAPDICISPNDASDAAKVAPCCCNTAAYALRQACWSCQHGKMDPSSPHRRPTFRQYLQCPESARSRQIFKAAKVPKWAFLPIEIDMPWSFKVAMVASKSKYKLFMNMMAKDPDDDDDHDGHSGKDGKNKDDSSKQAVKTSNTSTPSSGMSHTMMAIAIAGGVLAGLAAVACALAVAICLQRRRQKRRDAAEADRAPPSWYMRGNYIQNHVGASQSTFDLEGPPMAVVVSRPTLTVGSTASRRAVSWNSSLAREPTMDHSSGTGERTMVQSTVYGYGTLKPQRLSSTDTHSFSI
ncbi:hypothetical protein AURDEDRAFT_110036 [Auricularia subglabra TFB-10046 SS5]|nr:hypothetical protein AURDEDRAFT_110036 [Auricularia subglabra TFB-10046 SS5]